MLAAPGRLLTLRPLKVVAIDFIVLDPLSLMDVFFKTYSHNGSARPAGIQIGWIMTRVNVLGLVLSIVV